MLTPSQIRKLTLIEAWLEEIKNSPEFRSLEYSPDVALGDSLQGIRELLREVPKEKTHKPQLCL
jgi:hypothetical protein